MPTGGYKMKLDFLPHLPWVIDNFLLFGVLLLAGLIGGEVAARTRFLPRITGYSAVGIVLGSGFLNVLDQEALEHARIFVDIALGLILFDLGRRLDFNWLVHDKWLLLTGLLESALSFLLMFFALTIFGVPSLYAALAAAIGISTSPAVTLMVANDLEAGGQVTRRALSLVAINNVMALLTITILLSFLHREFQAGWLNILAHPLYLLVGSVVLGYVMYRIIVYLARFLGKHETSQLLLQVGGIMLAIGLANTLKLPVFLTVLILGILSKNFDFKHEMMEVKFGRSGQIFFIVLFVVVGSSLQWGALGTMGWTVLAYLVARIIGKTLGIFVFYRASKLSSTQAAMLSLTMFPMAGLAIGMTQSIAGIYPEFGVQLTAIVIATTGIMFVVGPIVTQFALIRAGEASPEKIAKP